MNLLRRLAVILFAFLASAAAVVPVFLLLLLVVKGEPPVPMPEVFSYAIIAFVVLAVITSLPAAVVIAAAEWRRIRHWSFFVVAGGLTAALLLVLLGFVHGLLWPPASISALLIISGLTAGLVYWRIAGHSSGALRDAWAQRVIA